MELTPNRGLGNPRGQNFSQRELASDTSKKFQKVESAFAKEGGIDKLAMAPAAKRQRVRHMVNNMIENLEAQLESNTLTEAKRRTLRAKLKAWMMWDTQMEHGALEEGSDALVLKNFYAWLLGKGREEDHRRTPWGRRPEMVELDDVREWLGSFIDVMVDTKTELTKLAWKTPQNLEEAWLYYKFLIHMDWVKEDDALLFVDIPNMLAGGALGGGYTEDQLRRGVQTVEAETGFLTRITNEQERETRVLTQQDVFVPEYSSEAHRRYLGLDPYDERVDPRQWELERLGEKLDFLESANDLTKVQRAVSSKYQSLQGEAARNALEAYMKTQAFKEQGVEAGDVEEISFWQAMGRTFAAMTAEGPDTFEKMKQQNINEMMETISNSPEGKDLFKNNIQAIAEILPEIAGKTSNEITDFLDSEKMERLEMFFDDVNKVMGDVLTLLQDPPLRIEGDAVMEDSEGIEQRRKLAGALLTFRAYHKTGYAYMLALRDDSFGQLTVESVMRGVGSPEYIKSLNRELDLEFEAANAALRKAGATKQEVLQARLEYRFVGLLNWATSLQEVANDNTFEAAAMTSFVGPIARSALAQSFNTKETAHLQTILGAQLESVLRVPAVAKKVSQQLLGKFLGDEKLGDAFREMMFERHADNLRQALGRQVFDVPEEVQTDFHDAAYLAMEGRGEVAPGTFERLPPQLKRNFLSLKQDLEAVPWGQDAGPMENFLEMCGAYNKYGDLVVKEEAGIVFRNLAGNVLGKVLWYGPKIASLWTHPYVMGLMFLGTMTGYMSPDTLPLEMGLLLGDYSPATAMFLQQAATKALAPLTSMLKSDVAQIAKDLGAVASTIQTYGLPAAEEYYASRMAKSPTPELKRDFLRFLQYKNAYGSISGTFFSSLGKGAYAGVDEYYAKKDFERKQEEARVERLRQFERAEGRVQTDEATGTSYLDVETLLGNHYSMPLHEFHHLMYWNPRAEDVVEVEEEELDDAYLASVYEEQNKQLAAGWSAGAVGIGLASLFKNPVAKAFATLGSLGLQHAIYQDDIDEGDLKLLAKEKLEAGTHALPMYSKLPDTPEKSFSAKFDESFFTMGKTTWENLKKQDPDTVYKKNVFYYLDEWLVENELFQAKRWAKQAAFAAPFINKAVKDFAPNWVKEGFGPNWNLDKLAGDMDKLKNQVPQFSTKAVENMIEQEMLRHWTPPKRQAPRRDAQRPKLPAPAPKPKSKKTRRPRKPVETIPGVF